MPNYNPAYVWGPPVWGYYPPLDYPGIDIGLGWYPGIDIGLWFGGWGGWGWGGWGWGPDWFGGGVFLDHSFFNRYGFRGGFGGTGWAVPPGRMIRRTGLACRMPIVRSPTGSAAARPGASFGRGEGGRQAVRGEPGQRLGNKGFEQRGWTGKHSAFGGYHNGGMTRMQSDRGFSSMRGGRGGFGGGGFHGGGGGMHGGGGGRR